MSKTRSLKVTPTHVLIALTNISIHVSSSEGHHVQEPIVITDLQGLFKEISKDCAVFLLLARQGFSIEYYFRKNFPANVLNK